MKRFGFLYEEIVSIDNCKRAIIKASKNKRSRKVVKYINKNIDFYARDLSERLISLDITSPYTRLVIKDGLSGKERELQIPEFYPDQCVHHAIMQVLKPIILKSSYKWSCSNIPKRGIKHAQKGVERATRQDVKYAKYCVKMDIKKFYPSIPHDKLKACLRRRIKDEKALKLIEVIIDSHPKGLPIGNYTSPWLAELYLQPLDHFIKQVLKVKHLVRYADDIVMIGNNKKKLRQAMYAVIEYLKELGLEVKHNYQLFRIQNYSREKSQRKGRKIDFVGFCFGKNVTTIRKRRALEVMRHSRRLQKQQKMGLSISYKNASGFLSRSSCFKNTDSKAMRDKYYFSINISQLKEVIRNESKKRSLARCY